MTHEMKIAYVREAAHSVFATMLGVELTDCEPAREEEAPLHGEGIVGLVGLAGDWAGTGAFRCSAAMAMKISGLLLMQDFPSVDQEVLDAIGEITNMVLGNVKTSFEAVLGPMGLSIPTVIYGRNFVTRSVGRSEWTVVPFRLDGEVIEIQVSLAPGRNRSADGAARGRLSTVLTMEG